MGIPGGARTTPAAPRPPVSSASKFPQSVASQPATKPASSAPSPAGSRPQPDAKPGDGAPAAAEPGKSEPIPAQSEKATWTHDKVKALVEQVRKVPKLNPRVSKTTLKLLNHRHRKLKERQEDARNIYDGRAFDQMCREANKLLTAYNNAVPKKHRKSVESFGRIR
jgi:hypothetical protein